MKYSHIQIFILFLLFSNVGCFESRSDQNIPNVDHINADAEVIRFDQILFQIDTNQVSQEIDSLFEKYPAFCQLYFNQILPFGLDGREELIKNVRYFLTEPNMIALNKEVEEAFNQFEDNIKPKFDRAYQYLNYYFPEKDYPAIYTLISEYAYQRFIFEDDGGDGIGLSLDLFLGADYPYKALDPKNPAFSSYITRTFNSDHMVKKGMELIVDDLLGPPNGKRMIDQMIHNGKRLYLLDQLLPYESDTVIIEYTEDQWQWVKDNELEMWSFFFDENLFYETNIMQINKYINPSPSSPGMPEQAPGRTANYLGWQIVKAYMKRNPELTLQDLITQKDAQNIMDESRYKPKRK